MKLKDIYSLLYDKTNLEIEKNNIKYILNSTYNYLKGYGIFEKEKTIIIDKFETFMINNKLLLDSEVVGIGSYEVTDSSELHVATVIFIDVEWFFNVFSYGKSINDIHNKLKIVKFNTTFDVHNYYYAYSKTIDIFVYKIKKFNGNNILTTIKNN